MDDDRKKEPKTLRRKREMEKKQETRREVFGWIRMFVIVVVVVFVLTRFIIINATIPSGSMETTIMTGDRLIGFRFSYWFDEPQRGDIILFSYPVDESQTYIKRVIGLPGETVEIRDGKIYIDGSDTPLEEDYLPEEWYWENDGYYFEVPEDCYFVLGDNRNNSLDGRFWAEQALKDGLADTQEEALPYSFVEKKKIKGKAIFTYYRSFVLLVNTADYQAE
ncbi:MAG: signal peptidase I [Lachnospiraceae bacterium]|nr:signal peptidase I [Lachnospiraceae bacterium]